MVLVVEVVDLVIDVGILINNVGIFWVFLVFDKDIFVFCGELEMNLFGLFVLVFVFVDCIVERFGVIVNVFLVFVWFFFGMSYGVFKVVMWSVMELMCIELVLCGV